MTKSSVFNYTYSLRYDTTFQCVVPDQPLHRWLAVSRFYVCRFVSPKFQLEGIEICRSWMEQIPVFNFLLIQINSFTNYQRGEMACVRIYVLFLVYIYIFFFVFFFCYKVF